MIMVMQSDEKAKDEKKTKLEEILASLSCRSLYASLFPFLVVP